MAEKPLTRWGYDAEETRQVVASTLSIAVVLGDLLDEVCIVGGLVPTLLIDYGRETTDEGGHCGTNDLDVGLTLAVLDDERYKEIAERLREAGFGHGETDEGRAVVQRWTMENLNVTIDFLIPPVEDEQRGGAIKHLESDFGAIVAPGLPLAFDERELVDLDGATLAGDRATRSVPVCGPAVYVVLKALAFRRRGTRKDAYDPDLSWPTGIPAFVTSPNGWPATRRRIRTRWPRRSPTFVTTTTRSTTLAPDRSRVSWTPVTRTQWQPTPSRAALNETGRPDQATTSASMEPNSEDGRPLGRSPQAASRPDPPDVCPVVMSHIGDSKYRPPGGAMS